MTRLVDRLEHEGLLGRDHCTDDGRGCFAVLTEKGADPAGHGAPTHLGGVRERFLSQFGEDELPVLADWWERVLPGASGIAETRSPSTAAPVSFDIRLATPAPRPHRHAEPPPRRGAHAGVRPARHQGRGQDARGARGGRARLRHGARNTFHLFLTPGHERIAQLGGLTAS